MNQLNFDGMTRAEVAIERIRQFEPPEGYYLAFSGGKDSIVLYDLTVKAGVKCDAHYNITGVDPPELVQFIKAHYPTVERHMPRESMWKLILKNGMPTRIIRWCCKEMKERGGKGRVILTGVRWQESARRKNRKMVESCYKDNTKTFVNPIIDWTNQEIWDHIKGNYINYCSLYDEGWKRLGCVLCPMAGQTRMKEAHRWPKITDAWKRASIRYWERDTDGCKGFASGEAFFDWWLSGKSSKKDESQAVMFE